MTTTCSQFESASAGLRLPTPRSSSRTGRARGLGMADFVVGVSAGVVGAGLFGVMYVPVKTVDAYDGSAFQFYQGVGIWVVGFAVDRALPAGEATPLVGAGLLGGFLWALSNYLVLPTVKARCSRLRLDG